MNQKYIEHLFFEQIKTLTLQTPEQTYDYQFSDGWSKKTALTEYDDCLKALHTM